MCQAWLFVFFKQKTAYEMRISDWSSDVCSSDLPARSRIGRLPGTRQGSRPCRKGGGRSATGAFPPKIENCRAAPTSGAGRLSSEENDRPPTSGWRILRSQIGRAHV